ncbi:MAG: ClpXP protease specificity-enhancing factor SspB [Ghiorsea sp.]|nr:ClpXP protease specificity-enhancing factor SspB [Ghiorsea sp.]
MSINFEDALKAKKLRNYFYKQGRIYIVVDATSDEVQVPEFLKGDPALRLVLNTRMPQPIYIRDGFVESNFSFSGAAYHCVIPLNRIWAAYVPEQDLGSGLMWNECVPETVKMVFEAVNELKEHEKDASPVQLVAKEMSVEKNTATTGKHKKEKEGKKFGHLRVVK